MTVQEQHLEHTHTLRVPRSRGAISGFLLIVLGVWGAIVPFIGPYFDYSFGSDQTWLWTTSRFWLEVLPGGAAALGGLLLLFSTNRLSGSTGGWLGAAAGAWFILGQTMAPLWRIGDIGSPLSTKDAGRAAAQLGYFYGLGVVILFLAAVALGRLSVVGVRDLRAAARREEQQRAAAQAQAAIDAQAETQRRNDVDRHVAAERRAAERETASRDTTGREAAGRGAAERESSSRAREAQPLPETVEHPYAPTRTQGRGASGPTG
jgi:hypothetical protein